MEKHCGNCRYSKDGWDNVEYWQTCTRANRFIVVGNEDKGRVFDARDEDGATAEGLPSWCPGHKWEVVEPTGDENVNWYGYGREEY